ncbi:hypothetical protein BDW22DRAFT_1354371 [Trametopsis cervina]|nr:hypothetical protein BDW22DRAFT_1354371 [Trametopsis cervina]
MYDLPTELWLKIIRSACLDDGSTARALSAVSHRIRVISHEFRYQSIAVTGTSQVQHLVDALQHPDHLGCRVEALFVDTDDISLITQLCSIVAPTVEILTIVAAVRRPDPSTTSPIDLYFPRLRELTVRGFIMLPQSNTFAPALERLEILYSIASTSNFFDFSAVNHPNLLFTILHSDLNCTDVEAFSSMLRLLSAVGLRVFDRQNKLSLSPQRSVALEFGSRAAQTQQVAENRKVHQWMLQQRFKRRSHFVLLPEMASGKGIARERWLDRVQGKDGIWALIEAKIQDNIRQARDESENANTNANT